MMGIFLFCFAEWFEIVTNDEANMMQSNLRNGTPYLNRVFKRNKLL